MRNNGRYEAASRPAKGGSKVVPFLIGAGIGAVAGAALALMFAPMAGEELRREAKEKFDDVSDGVNSVLRNAKMAAEKMLREGRGTTEEIIDRTRGKADDILDEADRAIAAARQRTADFGRSRNGEEEDSDNA